MATPERHIRDRVLPPPAPYIEEVLPPTKEESGRKKWLSIFSAVLAALVIFAIISLFSWNTWGNKAEAPKSEASQTEQIAQRKAQYQSQLKELDDIWGSVNTYKVKQNQVELKKEVDKYNRLAPTIPGDLLKAGPDDPQRKGSWPLRLDDQGEPIEWAAAPPSPADANS